MIKWCWGLKTGKKIMHARHIQNQMILDLLCFLRQFEASYFSSELNYKLISISNKVQVGNDFS